MRRQYVIIGSALFYKVKNVELLVYGVLCKEIFRVICFAAIYHLRI